PAREADDAPSWDSLRAAGDSGVLASGQEPAWAAAGPTAMLPRSNAAPEEPLAARGGGAATVKVGAFDDYDYLPPKRRAPGPLPPPIIILIVGAGAGVWLFIGGKKGETPQPSVTPLPPQPVAVAAPDAAPPPARNAKLEEGLAKLGDDTDAAFAEAEKLLDAAHVADAAADAKVWAALSLVNAVWSQALADDAEAAKEKAAELRAESERALQRAEKFAKEAEGRAPAAPETALAAAEVLRLKKAPTAEVEKKLAAAGDSADAMYARAMLRLRDGK